MVWPATTARAAGLALDAALSRQWELSAPFRRSERSRELQREWDAKWASGKFLPTPLGLIEFISRSELGTLIERPGEYLHMIPWEGALVTLFSTNWANASYAVALQIEEVVGEPVPGDPFTEYRPAERAFIRLAVRYLDVDSSLATLLSRLHAELDRWVETDDDLKGIPTHGSATYNSGAGQGAGDDPPGDY